MPLISGMSQKTFEISEISKIRVMVESNSDDEVKTVLEEIKSLVV